MDLAVSTLRLGMDLLRLGLERGDCALSALKVAWMRLGGFRSGACVVV